MKNSTSTLSSLQSGHEGIRLVGGTGGVRVTPSTWRYRLRVHRPEDKRWPTTTLGQGLAAWLRGEGYRGVLAPSAARPGSVNLTVFGGRYEYLGADHLAH